MTRPKGIGSCHKSGSCNNQGREQTTPCDKRCFNQKDIHENINELSSTVIPVTPPLNNLVINPPQLSLICQQSSRYSYNTSCDNRCFNRNGSNSTRNELSSPVIPVPPSLNDSVINPP